MKKLINRDCILIVVIRQVILICIALISISNIAYGYMATSSYNIIHIIDDGKLNSQSNLLHISKSGKEYDGKYFLTSYMSFYGEGNSKAFNNIYFQDFLSNHSAIDIYGGYMECVEGDSYIFIIGANMGNITYLFEIRNIVNMGASFYVYVNGNNEYEKLKIIGEGVFSLHFIKYNDYAIMVVGINNTLYQFQYKMNPMGNDTILSWVSLYSLNHTESSNMVFLESIIESYSTLSWYEDTISGSTGYWIYLLIVPTIILIADWGWSLSRKK